MSKITKYNRVPLGFDPSIARPWSYSQTNLSGTMHIGYHNDKHIYQMGSGYSRIDLNQVTSEKSMSITFQDDLQFTKHWADKV